MTEEDDWQEDGSEDESELENPYPHDVLDLSWFPGQAPNGALHHSINDHICVMVCFLAVVDDESLSKASKETQTKHYLLQRWRC